MGLFANLVGSEDALRVLDRLMWSGEQALLDIVKNTFQAQKQ